MTEIIKPKTQKEKIEILERQIRELSNAHNKLVAAYAFLAKRLREEEDVKNNNTLTK